MLDLLLTGVCGLAFLSSLAALFKAFQRNGKLRSPEARTHGTIIDVYFDAFERDLCLLEYSFVLPDGSEARGTDALWCRKRVPPLRKGDTVEVAYLQGAPHQNRRVVATSWWSWFVMGLGVLAAIVFVGAFVTGLKNAVLGPP